MQKLTQAQHIQNLKEQLQISQTAKLSIWKFSGEPKNFISKAKAAGLELVEQNDCDLIFRLKPAKTSKKLP